MGAEYRRGSMSAWLLKKKSGSAMMRMRQYNKRFFTIDFDSHVFFYSHAEGSKKVSSVIRFADIVDVQLPDPLRGAENNSTGGERRGSRLLRSFSGLSANKDGSDQAHHFVMVVIRPSMKTMELLCSSSMEAEQWHQALKEAMLFSKEDKIGACVTTIEPLSGDEEEDGAFRTVALSPPANDTNISPPMARSVDRKPPGPVGVAAMATAKAALSTPKTTSQRGQESTPLLSGGYPTSATDTSATLSAPSQQPTKASPPVSSTSGTEVKSDQALPSRTPAAVPQQSAVTSTIASSSTEANATTPTPEIAGDDSVAPPPTRGTFLDLNTEPIEPEAVIGSSSIADVRKEGVEAVQEVVIETGGLLQQSDFGFEAGDDTDSSGSAISTPRAGATDTFDGLASPTAKSPPVQQPEKADAALGYGKFGDRDRGLSMQERLQNLEFSDDEEYDDDDPLGLKSKPK